MPRAMRSSPGLLVLAVGCLGAGAALADDSAQWLERMNQALTEHKVPAANELKVLTLASMIPPAIIDADAATKSVLVVTHLLAAIIVIPAIASRLERRPGC